MLYFLIIVAAGIACERCYYYGKEKGSKEWMDIFDALYADYSDKRTKLGLEKMYSTSWIMGEAYKWGKKQD